MASTILVPGGSSTILVPPQGGGGGDTPTWAVVSEWDFTSLPAHTFAEGVPDALGGSVNWTAQNVAAADASYPGVTAAGLEVRLSSASPTNKMFSYEQTGPLITALVSDIVSGYSESDTISIQCLLSFAVTTAGTTAGFFNAGLITSDGGFGNPGGGVWNYAGNFSNGGGDSYATRFGGGPATGAGNPVFIASTGGSPVSFIDLVLFPGTSWTASMSLDTEFQDPLTVTTSVSHGNMEPNGSGAITGNPGVSPSFAITPANRRIGMFAYYQTNGVRDAAATATITKLRVLKRT